MQAIAPEMSLPSWMRRGCRRLTNLALSAGSMVVMVHAIVTGSRIGSPNQIFRTVNNQCRHSSHDRLEEVLMAGRAIFLAIVIYLFGNQNTCIADAITNGRTLKVQSSAEGKLANLVQERCEEIPVNVTAPSLGEVRVACSEASHALQLLGRCNITVQRPLHIYIRSEVRHPFGGVIFGLFDAKEERVLVTQEESVSTLTENTPYGILPRHDFYRSIIVHEVIHGVIHQNLKRTPTSHAAYEYPAYALQIESLSSIVRDKFLHFFDSEAIKADTIFNDSILLFDPYLFAARAYRHYRSSVDGCFHLRAVLEGEASFIAVGM